MAVCSFRLRDWTVYKLIAMDRLEFNNIVFLINIGYKIKNEEK